MSALWFGLIALALLLLGRELYRAQTRVGPTSRSTPGLTTLLSPLSSFNGLFPRLPFVSLGANWSWRLNYQLFHEVGCDVIAVRSLLPTPSTILLIADNDVAREIIRQRVKFPKPAAFLQVFSVFGNSIVNTEGEEWHRHRRIVGPTFNEGMNATVSHTTSDVMLELFSKWEAETSSPNISDHSFLETAMEIALLVLCRAGFGQFVDWNSHHQVPAGHSRSFREALEIVTTNVPLYTLLPTWLLNRFHHGRVVVEGFAEMRQYILETAEDRRASSLQEKPSDLLSNLVAAADDDLLNGQGGFSESDLVASLFFLFLAGYDSTAATLSFVMALLATHPEEQERLYKELKSVIEDREIPKYEDCLKFKFCLAVIYEASRLYSIASFVPKIASEPCVLQTRSRDGSPVEIPVEQGTVLLLSIDAIHMNPRYWPDPYEFKPSRFLDGDKIHNTGAFMSFSAGLRACIGRRFAEVELVTAVALIVLRYKVTVLKEAQFAHETPEETKTRVLQARKGLNLQPERIPLSFTRRG